jgi:hypothetical protein
MVVDTKVPQCDEAAPLLALAPTDPTTASLKTEVAHPVAGDLDEDEEAAGTMVASTVV